MTDRNIPTDEQVTGVTLDFEQRQRANRLSKAVQEDPLMAAFELIWLRAEVERLKGVVNEIVERHS